MPLTPSGLLEQPLSRSLNEGEDTEALKAASLLLASLARFASTPTPAARPMTAADSRAMMHERIKTSRLHPQTTLLERFDGGSRLTAACWENGEAAAVYGDAVGAVPAYVELSVYPSGLGPGYG